jgi:hypothetical protein
MPLQPLLEPAPDFLGAVNHRRGNGRPREIRVLQVSVQSTTVDRRIAIGGIGRTIRLETRDGYWPIVSDPNEGMGQPAEVAFTLRPLRSRETIELVRVAAFEARLSAPRCANARLAGEL